jgi:hypothetical protein
VRLSDGDRVRWTGDEGARTVVKAGTVVAVCAGGLVVAWDERPRQLQTYLFDGEGTAGVRFVERAK